MIGLHPDCPSDISMLADHLDTALAVGEEMMTCVLPPRSDLDESDPDAAPDAMDMFVRRLMQLESSLLLRVLRARRLTAAIGRSDAGLKAAGDLFRAQSEALHELILAAGEGADGQLARAGDGHAYLRSRGLIAPEAAAPSPFESVVVGEDFRIGGIAPVGQMLDLVSALLDLLDARYGLYSPDAWDGDSSEEQPGDTPQFASTIETVQPNDQAGATERDAGAEKRTGTPFDAETPKAGEPV